MADEPQWEAAEAPAWAQPSGPSGWQPAEAPPWTSDVTPAIGGGPARITVRPGGAEEPPPPTEPEPSWGDIAKDVGLSTAIGIPKGVIGMAGLPEAAAGYGASALGWLTGKDPEYWRDQGATRLPSTQQIRSKVEEATGPLYEPKTPYGQYGQTVGEFIPAAMTGPGGFMRAGLGPIAKTLGGRIFGQALIPGVASEAAGQAAESFDPAFGPYARGAAALLAGAPLVSRADRAAVNTARQDLITEANWGSKELYGAFDRASSNVPIPLAVKAQTSQQMLADLNRIPLPTDLGEKWVKDLGKASTVWDLVNWRRGMREKLFKEGEGRSAHALTESVDRAIDASMPAMPAGYQGWSQLLRSADRDFAHTKLMEAVTGRLEGVEQSTSAAASGKNFDNKLRQALITFKHGNTENAFRGIETQNFRSLTPTEQLHIDQMIQGGMPKNLMRSASNFAGGGGGMGKMVAMGVLVKILGPMGVPIAHGIGKLKDLENAMARRQAHNFVAEVMERSYFRPSVGRLRTTPLPQRVGRGIVYGGLPGTLAPESNQ